ncbi:hypothetical protein HBI13_137150 [Parastagonospora nodorum]|nr:hypothetical protein HBI10_073980 [Parastagonospora nodorum]KAH4017943.1 hypothetical protein HBI13_137150 [Parastagonospora nodorum]KAH4106192.1 hypothetical protein HBH46_075820 [Parastagonospora nodorum]KAH4186548.1 hypothetical protein HBH42_167520 [Parastagonospora nodorum]KAH4601488.1 hypothetical protein HBH82_172390 [Parastagonospora nodorum]
MDETTSVGASFGSSPDVRLYKSPHPPLKQATSGHRFNYLPVCILLKHARSAIATRVYYRICALGPDVRSEGKEAGCKCIGGFRVWTDCRMQMLVIEWRWVHVRWGWRES